jgi:hypothetical protein
MTELAGWDRVLSPFPFFKLNTTTTTRMTTTTTTTPDRESTTTSVETGRDLREKQSFNDTTHTHIHNQIHFLCSTTLSVLLKMPLSRPVSSLVLGLTLLSAANGFSSNSPSFVARQPTALSVASQEVKDTQNKEDAEKISYVVSRGDGSTGGGGLPMPQTDGGDGLARPKVGAKMPEG